MNPIKCTILDARPQPRDPEAGLLATGVGLVVTSYWLLVSGFWLLACSLWAVVTDQP